MAGPSHPRSLKDVSHLFLSSVAPPTRPERPPAEAVVLLVAAGRSAGRARLAAGTAAAFARHGTRVSVCELAGDLPNVGYYFGLEPADYLAPALDRPALVAGAWNGSVRFASSRDPRSLLRSDGGPPPEDGSHVVVAACTALDGLEPARAVSAAIGAFAAEAPGAPRPPDAIVIADTGEESADAGALVREARGRWPEAIVFLLARGARGDAGGADERFAAPADFEEAAPRRSPPADAVFDDLASLVLQRLGSRRRRREHRPAGG